MIQQTVAQKEKMAQAFIQQYLFGEVVEAQQVSNMIDTFWGLSVGRAICSEVLGMMAGKNLAAVVGVTADRLNKYKILAQDQTMGYIVQLR